MQSIWASSLLRLADTWAASWAAKQGMPWWLRPTPGWLVRTSATRRVWPDAWCRASPISSRWIGHAVAPHQIHPGGRDVWSGIRRIGRPIFPTYPLDMGHSALVQYIFTRPGNDRVRRG